MYSYFRKMNLQWSECIQRLIILYYIYVKNNVCKILIYCSCIELRKILIMGKI